MTRRSAPGSPHDWLRYATSDLLVAASPPQSGVLLETLAFHAQQAAEKALKAALLHLTGEEPPFTHSLTRLLSALAPYAANLPLDPAAAEALTRYAVLARYPADLGELNHAEWQQALADARATVAWATALLGSGNQR